MSAALPESIERAEEVLAYVNVVLAQSDADGVEISTRVGYGGKGRRGEGIHMILQILHAVVMQPLTSHPNEAPTKHTGFSPTRLACGTGGGTHWLLAVVP